MNQFPVDIQTHIMKLYFTHHVMTELSQLKHTVRQTNEMVVRFVNILNRRIQAENTVAQPNHTELKRLRYARDRWSNHLFHERENVTNVSYFSGFTFI
jgi:hypothetical protein